MTNHIRFALTVAAIALTGATAAVAQTALPVAAERARPDANGDGILTRAEATQHAEAQFARMDANRDGRVTPEDRAAGQERRRTETFARMDADNNGAITRAEWDRAGEAMAERREARRGELGQATGRAEGNREARGRGGRRGQMGRTMMARADANSDGAIDRSEFVAAATARFDRLDADRDGSVSTAERQAQRGRGRGATPAQ